ncbi:MAG: tetratricopeptide repeat protein [Prevotellaceae bacterium]|jgi:tetratricopeptide (TPR) repeat protein|nr:tetratricopeptide repeat protein [Prevotellaceae bacterium]
MKEKTSEKWLKEGYQYYKCAYYKEASECYDKVLELNPTNIDIWHKKGVIFTKLERYEESIQCYDKVIELLSKSKTVSIDNLKEIDVQNKNYSKLLVLRYQYINSLACKGKYLYKFDCYQEAIECYDKILEISPDDEYVQSCKDDSLYFLKLDKARDKYYKRYSNPSPKVDLAECPF